MSSNSYTEGYEDQYRKSKGKNWHMKSKTSSFKTTKEQKERDLINTKKELKRISELETFDWTKRGIRKETLDLFGVKIETTETEGPFGPVKVYFPYRGADGKKITGYKTRDWRFDKDEDGHWDVIGKVGVKCQLFGEKEVRKSAKKLYITEGEIDMLSLYQAMVDKNEGGEFEKYTPAVVSIQAGSPNALSGVVNREEFVKSYKEVVLCFDNDERLPGEGKNVKRGKEACDEVGCNLVGCDVYTLPISDKYNDLNEMLVDGKGCDLAKIAMWGCVKFKSDKILGVEDINFEELIKGKEKGVYISSFPKLMDRILGIRKRELTILTALSNVGKTFVVSEFAYCLAEQQNEKVALLFLEETEQETLLRMIARRINKNYYKLQYDPLKYATKGELKEAYDWCKDRFFFLDIFGGIPVDQLMNKIKNLVHVVGCGYIVLDHLSFVVTTLDQNQDERREIDKLMTELASFVAKTDAGIFAVSHLNGKASEEIGKIGDLKKPKWIPVKKEHMRGSRSLEQAAFNILGLDFEILPSRERGRVRLTSLKTRNGWSIGECDIFEMHSETGEIILFEDGYNKTGY